MIWGKKNTTSRLRQRLTLQEEVHAADGAGGYVRSWQNVADLWAEIQTISGREHLRAGQLQSEVSHRVIMRYRSGVMAGMRLLYDSRAFNIRYVINVEERKEQLEMLVEEGVA